MTFYFRPVELRRSSGEKQLPAVPADVAAAAVLVVAVVLQDVAALEERVDAAVCRVVTAAVAASADAVDARGVLTAYAFFCADDAGELAAPPAIQPEHLQPLARQAGL